MIINKHTIAVLAITLSATSMALAQDRFGQPAEQSPPAQGQWQQQPHQQGQWQQQSPQHGQWQQSPPQQGQWQQNPQQGQWQQPPPQQDQWQQQPRQQGQWQQPPRQGQWQQQPPQGQGPGGAPNPLAQLVQMERQDFGVTPQSSLNNGNLGGPTPASIPGGRVITTPEVLQMLNNPGGGAIVLDVLGGRQRLPNAVDATAASAGGSFDDRVQSQFEAQLGQMTGGRKEAPLILYCSSIHCWMSYNAALRAIHAGYTNVFWYRGSLEAWNTMAQMSAQFSRAQPQRRRW
jgi:rhodanese-related sulfurtransferase